MTGCLDSPFFFPYICRTLSFRNPLSSNSDLMKLNNLAKAALPLLLLATASCKETPNEPTTDNQAISMSGNSTRLVVETTPDLKLLDNSFTIEAWVTAKMRSAAAMRS